MNLPQPTFKRKENPRDKTVACSFGVQICIEQGCGCCDYDYVPCMRKIKPSLIGTTTNCYLHRNEQSEKFHCNFVSDVSNSSTYCNDLERSLCVNCCSNKHIQKKLMQCNKLCYQQNMYCDEHLLKTNCEYITNVNSNFNELCPDILLVIISYLSSVDIFRCFSRVSKNFNSIYYEHKQRSFCDTCLYSCPQCLDSSRYQLSSHYKCAYTIKCALDIFPKLKDIMEKIQIIFDLCSFMCHILPLFLTREENKQKWESWGLMLLARINRIHDRQKNNNNNDIDFIESCGKYNLYFVHIFAYYEHNLKRMLLN